MTNPAGFDFTKFVPGFDFLKNLTPGANASGGSAAPGWVAPTLDPEELDKRIQELKTVQFWLEQNTKAVGATIQALEVQRMTLNTLKGMNMSFNDLAESLKVKPEAQTKYTFTSAEAAPSQAEPQTPPEPAQEKPKAKPKARKASAQKAAAGVDPSQWWGALTDQFQHIATHAMNDMAHRAQAHGHAAPAQPAAPKTPVKSATKPAAKTSSAARKAAPRQTPVRKTTRQAKR